MRILHVIQELGTGGAEQVVRTLCEDSLRRGDAVAVACAGDAAMPAGITRFSIPMLRRNVVRAGVAAVQLRRHAAAWSPDVVHAHNPAMALVTSLATLRGRERAAAVTHHGVPGEDESSSARLLRVAGLPVVACGPDVDRALRRNRLRPLRVIRNGVGPPPHAIDAAALRRELRLPDGVALLVAVGRLAEQKRHDIAIEAMVHLSQAALLVVGEGPLRGRLERLIDMRGLRDRVRLLGARPAWPILAAADVVVHPSAWEGLPVALLEALRTARPVVASGCAGIRDLIQDGVTGLVVPPGSPDALATAATRLLDDSALASRLGEAGRALVERDFNAAAMAASYQQLWRDLIASRQCDRRSDARRKLLMVAQPVEGGVAQHVVDVACELRGRGFEVTVACPPQSFTAMRLAAEPAIRRLPFTARRAPHPSDLLWMARLLPAVMRNDVLHAHSSKASWVLRGAAVLAGRRPRCVITPHGWSYWAVTGAARHALITLERAAAPACAAIVTVSRHERDDALAHGIGRPDRYRVIPNGIDVRRFGAVVRDPDPNTVLMVGRLAIVKRHELALQAIALARDSARLRLLIAGDGERRGELLQLITMLELDGAVELLGNQDDVTTLLARCGCLLMTSRYEAMSLTVLEAMAVGAPVVAVRIPGMDEIVQHERTGILCDEEPRAVADALLRLQADPELAGRLGAAARAAAMSRHTRSRMADDLVGVYSSLAGAGRSVFQGNSQLPDTVPPGKPV